MNRVRETVRIFLNRPLTHQVQIMSKFDYEWEWTKDPAHQRHEFFTQVRKAGRVEEFSDYMLGVEDDEVSTI